MTYKVLLAAGRAAGRIVDVEDDATSVQVQVPALPSPPGPSVECALLVLPEQRMEKLTYTPMGDPPASGYPVWRHVAAA